MKKKNPPRQKTRMFMLLFSFAFFPITVLYLSPASPLLSLKAGVINLSVFTVAAVLLSGFIFRRAFCGWLCPGGGCQLISGSLNEKRIEVKKTNWVRIGLVTVWVIVMIVSVVSAETEPRIEPLHPGAGRFATSDIRWFLPYIPVVVTMFLFILMFGRRGFCARGCWIYPLIASTSKIGQVLHLPSLYVRAVDLDNCKNCKICTKICPMSIDVNETIKQRKPLPNNCIQCGLCIDECPRGVYAFAFGIEKHHKIPHTQKVTGSNPVSPTS
ncbi:4Fe-4S binding protein [Gemmatimonadota bacterium]